MKIIGLYHFSNNNGGEAGPYLRNVVVDRNGKVGIIIKNPNNIDNEFWEAIDSSTSEDELEKCINFYAGLKSRQNERVDNRKYIIKDYKWEDIVKSSNFKMLSGEYFRPISEIEFTSDNKILAFITENHKTFIGNIRYLLEIIDTLYPDSNDEVILEIKRELLNEIGKYEESKLAIQTILDGNILDCTLRKIYIKEIQKLNKRIKGKTLLDEKINVKKR